MPRVSDFCVDQQGTITNDVPISTIPLTEGEIKKTKKSKRSTKKTKKGKSSEKSSVQNKEDDHEKPIGNDQENIDSEPKSSEEPKKDVKTSDEALTTMSPDEHQNKTS
jgi:hypothetical protein